ncbi:hypothetical protein QNM99_06490 [Pseudomonas sp. PCH446]
MPQPRQAQQLEQDIALGSDDQARLLAQARQLVDADKYDDAVKIYRQLLDGRQPQGHWPRVLLPVGLHQGRRTGSPRRSRTTAARAPGRPCRGAVPGQAHGPQPRHPG